MIAEPDETEKGLGGGSDTSFALLVEQYHGKVLRFIGRYIRSRQDAEDLTQDTFVKAFRYFHRYDSQYAFSAWLYTIARRTVYNHNRSAREMSPLEFDIADGASSPSDEAEKADSSQSIWNAAKKLKADYREALVLKYVEDLSVKEIASVMNKTQRNVKIMLFRARNQLKKINLLK